MCDSIYDSFEVEQMYNPVLSRWREKLECIQHDLLLWRNYAGGSARKSLKELTQDVDSILYDIEYLCQNFNASGIDDVSERVNKAVVAFKEYKETCIDVSHPRKRCRGVTCSTSESD